MSSRHRATAEQWACIERMLPHPEFSAIVELRDRIEALEAAAQPAKPNYPEIPDGSLKERITLRMIEGIGSTWEATGASVLFEIAAWLDTVQKFDAAALLRLEAER